MLSTSASYFCVCLLFVVELSFSSGSPLTADYSSVNTESLSITPTITPRPSCMCNMSDCVCNTQVCFFLQTAPLVGVLPVVVSTGFIIVTALVVIACLLMVVKYKHRKNSLGEDCTAVAANAVYSLFFCCFFFIFTAPIDHNYWTHTTTESRLVLSHMHVQICLLTIFHFTSRFFYRYVKKKDLKVKVRHTILHHFVLSEFEFSAWYGLPFSVHCTRCLYMCIHKFHHTQWPHHGFIASLYADCMCIDLSLNLETFVYVYMYIHVSVLTVTSI